MKTSLRIFLFAFILVIGLGILAVYWTFYKPLPDYSATHELPELQAPVDIHWDTFGVPHIYSENRNDLYFTIGYIHAQERLWQMTLSQITAEGRFAEFFGADFIDYDKYQRTLGFWETAQRIEREAPEELLDILEDYSRGVNAYVRENRKSLPIEFTLLNLEPIPWTPAYSIAISRLMAWEMNVSWWSKPAFASIAEHLPASVFQELIPVYDDNDPTMMDDGRSRQLAEFLLPLVEKEFEIRNLTGRRGTSVGSNAWAVAGSRTESGYPILAGDPHMGLFMPGHWFELHISQGGRNLSGATIPGAPLIVLGQNEEFAWSLTNMMADDTDFFMERPDPNDDSRYVVDSLDGSALYDSYEWRDEIIRVQDGDDELFRVKSTKQGPVVSGIYPDTDLAGEYEISMNWTGHEVSQELWSLYKINWAENFDQFQDGLRHFKSPGQNFVYADRSGNIAIFSAAGLPVRDHSPLIFRKGWDSSYDWQGWIPFEELPRVVNPPEGYVANANNKLHTDSYPHYIATFWESPARIQRIEEFFLEHDTLSTELFQQMQFDDYSVHAREVVEIILPVLRLADESYDFSSVTPYLENWDFTYNPSSTAASLLDIFFLKLTQNTLRERLGESAYQNFIRVESVPVRVMFRLLTTESFLFNLPGTDRAETREDLIVRSMDDAIRWLEEHYGDESFEWRWENLHTITFKPPLFHEASEADGSPAVLRLIVNNLMSKGPFPVHGHGMTLNKGEYNWSDPFEVVLGPSIRRIADMSALNRTFSVLPTGQSGNPLSDFYGDQTDLWLNGQYRYFYQDSTFFREVSFQSTRLNPSAGGSSVD